MLSRQFKGKPKGKNNMSINIQYTRYRINGKEFGPSSTTKEVQEYACGLLQPDTCPRVYITRTTFTENIQDGQPVLQKESRTRCFHLNYNTRHNLMTWLSDYPKRSR